MHNSLVSKVSPNVSLNESYAPRFSEDLKNEMKEKRLESLKCRQEKLARILQAETARYEAEMKRKRSEDKENEPQYQPSGLFSFQTNNRKVKESNMANDQKLHTKWRIRNQNFF